MPLHLLDLPTELLEHILVLLCHINAQSIQACRQTCHALNATIAHSKLVQYLEHLALLGLYDPLLHLVDGGRAAAIASASLALPDRAAALRAWEESWDILAGGGGDHDHDAAAVPDHVFWQKRKPDLLIAPLHPSPSSWPNSPRVKYMLANILEPDPPSEYQLAVDTTNAEAGQHWRQYGYLDENDHFSFGPWFVAATRDGLNVRAYYSYLDLHGCLGDVGGGGSGGSGGRGGGWDELWDGDASVGAEYDRVFWTVIKIPLWNVVGFVLSTELDLTVVISISKYQDDDDDDEEEEEEEGEEESERKRKRKTTTTTHLVLRPLRFRDGTPHPCAKVPVMRLSVKGATVFHWTQAQVLGDYLLLWIGPGEADYSLCKLYLVAWKTGSITLLREFHPGMYGAIPAMISKDVLALVQLNPPGIELCRISNMGKEVEDEAGGGEGGGGEEGSGGPSSGDRQSGPTNDNSRGRSGRSDGRPRMDKLCTLLLPPLREERDGTGARVLWGFCIGEHPGHQTFSRGPWPDYRGSRLARRHMFRQSTKDSVFSVVIAIEGCKGELRTFQFIVRCATLLAYADAARGVSRVTVVVPTPTPTPTVAVDAESSDGDGAEAQVVAVGGVNAEEGVPWAAWGPRATALLDQTHVGWRNLLGERKATIEQGAHRIRIHDYNPYRIRQAKASMVAKGLGRHEWGGDSHEHEGEDSSDEGASGIVDPFPAQVSRRITERGTTRAGEWFEEEVRTALPQLEVVMDVPGCRAIYMEQDQVLLQVDDLGKITGRANRMNDINGLVGFALYSM